jgi:ADP-ribose pyrophosphatase YjhB (NUDIX family)
MAKPSMLACGMLEDNGRVLLLVRNDANGKEKFGLPCALVMAGEDPVSILTSSFRSQTGIDAQVHEIALEGRHNAGSRKRKAWIPAMVFRVSAKSARVSVSAEFSGFKWVAKDEIANLALSRDSEWLRNI